MHFTFFVPGAPRVKGRPRFVRNTGKTYTPKEVVQEEQRIQKFYRDLGGPTFEGFVAVEATYYKDGVAVGIYDRPEPGGTFRGDLDNYFKLTGDALQGVAFPNDKRITRIDAVLDGALFDGDPEARLVPNLG